MTLFGCRHRNKTRPVRRRYSCLDCGESFVFDAYDLTDKDREQAATVQHYQHNERALTKIQTKILRWRKQG